MPSPPTVPQPELQEQPEQKQQARLEEPKAKPMMEEVVDKKDVPPPEQQPQPQPEPQQVPQALQDVDADEIEYNACPDLTPDELRRISISIPA
ncbi:unnamed protein product [Toxocara canis]|nr:unnamed protein product [Toxocara canis]